MKTFKRLALVASLAFAATLPMAQADAGLILETAANSGTNGGDYTLASYDLIGAAFTIDTPTRITGIGAEFEAIFGTVFGAIVPLASLDSMPTGSSQNLASIALASTVFTSGPSPYGDLIVPISVDLAPGTYGVIFGSGQFGADGYIGLGDSNTAIAGNFPLFQSIFSDGWDNISDSGVRILVEGSPLPEAGTWATMILGLGAVGGSLRAARRTRKPIAA